MPTQFGESRAGGKGAELVFEILLRSFGVINGGNRFLQNGGCDREHLGVGARNGPPGFQAADGGEPPGVTEGKTVVARTEYGLDADGNGNIVGVAYGNAVETRRRNAENFERIAIHSQPFSNH